MTKTHKALPPAFPHAPNGPGAKHELKVMRKGKMVLLMNFAATYSAKKFLDIVLGKDKISWLKDKGGTNFIALEDIDIEVHCDELEDIIEHEFTKDEKEWTLPEPYPQTALRARGEKVSGKTKPVIEEEEIEDGDIPGTGETGMRRGKGRARSARSEPSPEKRKGPPQREVPKGMITIGALCSELKLEPRVARGILRSSETPKPDEGWMWDKKGAEAIKALLKKEMKK